MATTPQQHADRLRVFRDELAALERQQVLTLTPEQRTALDAHIEQTLAELATRHDVDTSESERHISVGMKIASALGGLALCVAVVLFLRRYLGLWPLGVQVAVLVSLPIGLTLVAEYVSRRERARYYTGLLGLVAFAAFVANLSLIGAIFNMAPTPHALAAWGGFGLALAYHFGLRTLLACGLVSLLGWVVSATNLWRGWWWWEFERRPEELMVAGALCGIVGLFVGHARLPGFPQVYRLLGVVALFLPALYLSADGSASYLPWTSNSVELFYQMAGVVAGGLVVWLGIRNDWNEVINAGSFFFAVFLLVRLVDWWWDVVPTYLFFVLIGGIAIGLVAVFRRVRSRVRSVS